jgi:hypothetical protein
LLLGSTTSSSIPLSVIINSNGSVTVDGTSVGTVTTQDLTGAG